MQSDFDIIRTYQSGNSQALWELFERYVDQIYAFILRKVSDREIAEDLSSQLWMKVTQKLWEFRQQEGASFKSWIYMIANNLVIDYYRTKKENISLEEFQVFPGEESDFAQKIDERDMLVRVREFVWDLWKMEAEIFFLRVWDDLSYKEIAQVVEKSEDACKQSYSRTLKKVLANMSYTIILFFLFLI